MSSGGCPGKVSDALAWAKSILAKNKVATSEWDAALLLAHLLGVSRAELHFGRERGLTAEERRRFQEAVARRASREPLQYLIGSQGFMGLEFSVDRRVLIPRPDTEILVEAVLDFLAGRAVAAGVTPAGSDAPDSAGLLVADIGTGSGAIAISLARLEPRCRVAAVDLSPDALEVARANARSNGVEDRVQFLCGDLLDPLKSLGPFDALVSNPPYIPPEEALLLEPEVGDHEPQIALLSGPDPLSFYRRLALGAGPLLKPGGCLAVEVGAGRAPEVESLFRRVLPASSTRMIKDYGGHERVVMGFLTDQAGAPRKPPGLCPSDDRGTFVGEVH